MKIGILCPADIASRRFMPALEKVSQFEFAGVAVNTAYERYGESLPDQCIVESMLERGRRKAEQFVNSQGGKIYESFESIICDSEISAIYIPLPPAMHYKWAKKALLAGKHVLLEKPFTTEYIDTNDLIHIADERGLALHENYMFLLHSQIDAVDDLIQSGTLGKIRLYRIHFGFPFRSKNDFRYIKSLGGGSLLDAGGYTIKYASHLLGATVKIVQAQLNYAEGFDVDIYGSGVLTNVDGAVAQIAFGMDNHYKCELEVWGSDACLYTGRILTAPVGFVPSVTVKRNNDEQRVMHLEADDSFEKSIRYFYNCIMDEKVRRKNYFLIKKQAELINDFIELSAES